LLVEYSLEIKPGDLFVIRGETTHEPLLRELYRLSVRIGAEPVLRISLPGQAAVFYTEASDDTLELPSRFDEFLDEHEAAELVLLGSAIPYALSGVDPARIVRHSNAHRDRMMRRTERLVGENADIRGCVSLLPIPSLAQAAKMSLTDYESFVYKAMHLFEPDPVQWWREFSEKQGKYCDFLNGVHDIRIVAEDTDLKINISNRKWINADGRFNFPDGEVYTSPVETSANGHIRYTYPTIHQGWEAEDVHLWFQDGCLSRWEAKTGKKYLDEVLCMDDGARRIGEFAIGTNYAINQFTKNILFDEKIGGTCHLALGQSIGATGGKNQSILHWDMIRDLRDGGTIYADGEAIHDGGYLKL